MPRNKDPPQNDNDIYLNAFGELINLGVGFTVAVVSAMAVLLNCIGLAVYCSITHVVKRDLSHGSQSLSGRVPESQEKNRADSGKSGTHVTVRPVGSQSTNRRDCRKSRSSGRTTGS